MAADDDKLRSYFLKSAERGVAKAQYNLGVVYELGFDGARDYDEALRWYRKAADQEYALAQYDLGRMYAEGRGVTQDDHEAVRLWHKSAEGGYVLAQYNLGLMYIAGRGVAQDFVQGYIWLSIAFVWGIQVAEDLRQLVRRKMNDDQITESEKQVATWLETHKKRRQ